MLLKTLNCYFANTLSNFFDNLIMATKKRIITPIVVVYLRFLYAYMIMVDKQLKSASHNFLL